MNTAVAADAPTTPPTITMPLRPSTMAAANTMAAPITPPATTMPRPLRTMGPALIQPPD